MANLIQLEGLGGKGRGGEVGIYGRRPPLLTYITKSLHILNLIRSTSGKNSRIGTSSLEEETQRVEKSEYPYDGKDGT